MSLDSLLSILRDGNWLTPGRLRLWASAVLIASAAGLVFLFATAHGLNDYQNRPLGTDFSNIYVAGTLALEGHPEAPYDPKAQYARAQALFGAGTPIYRWHYPPLFHLLAAPLAAMPYLPSLAVWQGVTLALYLLTILSIARFPSRPVGAAENKTYDRVVLLLALAFPAVFVNVGHGHNGLLTAALIGSGLLVLDRRPILAGVLFGLLAYKPQFGLMIPLVLLATGRWRTIFAATATVAVMVLAVTVVFGIETWRAFLDFSATSRQMMENGDAGWPLIQSPFAGLRMLHAPVTVAYAAQGAITLAIAASLAWLWRSEADFALKAAALCLGTILATPYCLDYDMLVLAPAIAFFGAYGLRRGFAPYEITALSALWAAPLVARSIAELTAIPLGASVMLVMFVVVMRRARTDLAVVAMPVPAE
jgi:glycosyl transferase family 87